ncbi:MAG: hypothetical protein Q4D81_13390, partial [Eubacteriales bacterium]|nr:hypothetical protein [Eubacteriales bacterium]
MKNRRALAFLLSVALAAALPFSTFASTAEPAEAADPCAEGHDLQEEVTEPTCTSGGYTTVTCSRCDFEEIKDLTQALGHDYQEEVTEPTCTKGGYTTVTCSRCDFQDLKDETQPL